MTQTFFYSITKYRIHLLALILIGLAVVFNSASSSSTDAKPISTSVISPVEQPVKLDIPKLQNLGKQSLNTIESVDAQTQLRITQLNTILQKHYHNTLRVGGLDKPTTFDYYDDWCVSQEDLSEGDQYRANQERQEWLVERGHIWLNETVGNIHIKGINNEYIAPYQELDLDTLQEFANDNDRMALSTIIQKYHQDAGVTASQANDAAFRLIILGETAFGLEHVVSNNLNTAAKLAREASNNKAVNYDARIKSHLLNALSFVEYGLTRKDTKALTTFLIWAREFESLKEKLKYSHYISPDDFTQIQRKAADHSLYINALREEMLLPAIDITESSRIEQVQYDEHVARLYRQFPNLLSLPWLMTHWQDSYLAQTPCVARLVARDKYLKEQRPNILREIAALEKQLNRH